jgi:hypothetical protein
MILKISSQSSFACLPGKGLQWFSPKNKSDVFFIGLENIHEIIVGEVEPPTPREKEKLSKELAFAISYDNSQQLVLIAETPKARDEWTLSLSTWLNIPLVVKK